MLTLQNATKLKEDFSHLIGEEYKDSEIEVLLILPRNNPGFQDGLATFLRTENPNLVQQAEVADGYTVIALMDLKTYVRSGVLFHGELINIIHDKELEFDSEEYGLNK